MKTFLSSCDSTALVGVDPADVVKQVAEANGLTDAQQQEAAKAAQPSTDKTVISSGKNDVCNLKIRQSSTEVRLIIGLSSQRSHKSYKKAAI